MLCPVGLLPGNKAHAMQQQQQQQLGLSLTVELLVVHACLALLAVAVCLPGGLRSSTAQRHLRQSCTQCIALQ
jgi:hypothetical protein